MNTAANPPMVTGTPALVQVRRYFLKLLGTGQGTEQSNLTEAVDDSGDAAIVWTSYNPAPLGNPSGKVYLRIVSAGDKLTADVLVTDGGSSNPANSADCATGNNAAVASDLDGNSVVVWQSQVNGTWNIYGQMFDSLGNRVGSQFQVNTSTQYDALKPAVAMDNQGGFAVAGSVDGESDPNINDIGAEDFNYLGQPVGTELQCSTPAQIQGLSIPNGTTPNDVSVRNNGATGGFEVVWDAVNAVNNGVSTNPWIMARRYNADTTTVFTAFGGIAPYVVAVSGRNPQVAMMDNTDTKALYRDDCGSFVITYEVPTTVPGFYTQVDYATFDNTGFPSALAGQANSPLSGR